MRGMTGKKKPVRKVAKARKRALPPRDPDGLAELLQDLALLTAVNNVMAQTAFLSLERMRISTEVVDERITNDFGAELFARCEQVVRASDDLVLEMLDKLGAEGPRADLVRSLIGQRRQLQERGQRAMGEQPRLVESLERMYR
ncbi:MAG: hypothetical protein LC624_05730 [Halobacteriales archaeon]|nr:hypothetical protein [Halobacteriales archaeon]